MKSRTKSQIVEVYNKGHNRELIMLGFAMLVVFIIAVRYVGENYSLKVWGDEFGYWQSAAYLTGRDWSSIISTNSYYGFGYGVLLVPFMWLFSNNSVLMMQGALVLEAIMLTSCVAAAYFCIGYFSDQIKGITRVVLALLPVLYPSNILYVNLTLAEILLTALTWWYTYVALRFIREKKISLAVILMILSVYMYSVHQRTLMVMVISLVLIGCIYRKKLFAPKVFLVIGVFGGSLLLVLLFKKIYVAEMYVGVDETLYANNNLSGQAHKIVDILTSWEGFARFLASIVGKFYYIVVASAMLVVLGFIKCVQTLFDCIKNKSECDNKLAGMLVITFNFLAVYMIAVIYMSAGYGDRTDILIYGRYIEHAVGPLIVLGAIYLYECDRIKEILVAMGITGLTTVCVDNIVGYHAKNSHIWVNCSAIADLISESQYVSGEALYYAFIRSCIFLSILYFALRFHNAIRDWALNIAIVCLCIFWVGTGYAVRNDKVIPWGDRLYKNQIEVLDYIDEQNFGIYSCTLGGIFQFLRVDSEVRYYARLEDIFNSTEDMYIISDANADGADQIRAERDILFENSAYILWRSGT